MKLRSATGALLLATALGLSGCGVIYNSPLVNEREAGDGVQVVPITRQSVPVANRVPYQPRALPAVFSQLTGGGSPRGAGALPPAPVLPNLEPGSLELRPPPSAESQPYQIGVGDVIQLATRAVTAVPSAGAGATTGDEIRQTYTVRDDGTIAVPEVGAVEIGGLSIEEAEQQIFERFIETGIDPDFSLEVAGFNSQRISVGGAVGEPAVLPVTLNLPTLDEAIAAAGGLDVTAPEFASIRIYRDGTLYQIPLSDFNLQGDLRNLVLAPGDSVFVDTTYDLDRALEFYAQQIEIASLRREERAAALSELATEIGLRRAALEEAREVFESRVALDAEARDYVYLAGEVTVQDRFPLPYGRQASLADALFDTGGFETETGNPSQIYVLRENTDPSLVEPVVAWHLDARNAGNLVLATQFELRPNDVIFIEEQPITRWNRAFQQFFPVVIDQVSGTE